MSTMPLQHIKEFSGMSLLLLVRRNSNLIAYGYKTSIYCCCDLSFALLCIGLPTAAAAAGLINHSVSF